MPHPMPHPMPHRQATNISDATAANAITQGKAASPSQAPATPINFASPRPDAGFWTRIAVPGASLVQ